MYADFSQAFFLRPFQNRVVERAFQYFGQNGYDVDTHLFNFPAKVVFLEKGSCKLENYKYSSLPISFIASVARASIKISVRVCVNGEGFMLISMIFVPVFLAISGI